MEFRILGPLEVVDDQGRPVPVHRGKEQALLAYLLLHPNELLASERLIHELWEERAPPTAPKILQNAVSRLRKALGEGRLVTQAPGYRFRLEPGELDLHRFERLAEEGRAARDPERLREALALWRGEPLANVREEPFAQRAALHLEDTRLGVLEDRIDADLTAGRHTELASELEHLIAQNPLRERLHGQLMLALYRAGRQADALEAYQRARKTLSQQLGLEPGPQLQELERKILTQDPALAAPVRADRRVGSPVLRRRPSVRLALAAVAIVLVVAAAISLGLIFALDEDSQPLVVKPNSLVVVDPSRNKVVGVVPVGASPRGVAVGRAGVWVANSAEGTVSKVDLEQLKVVQTIGIGAQATEIAIAAGALWVATGVDNSLVKVDARSGGVLGKLPLPADVAAAAYAVAAGNGAVWVISGARLVKIDARTDAILGGHRQLNCCGGLRDIAFGVGAVWVADTKAGVVRISALSTHETGSVKLGAIPTALAAAYGSVWVASASFVPEGIVIWRLHPQTLRVSQTVSVGKATIYLPTVDIAAGAGAIWVTNHEEGTLVRIDPASGTVVATIHLGHHPWGIAVGAHRVWVSVN